MCECWVPYDCLYGPPIPFKLLYADKKSLSRTPEIIHKQVLICPRERDRDPLITDNNDNNDITHRERARKREHPTDDEKIHKTLKTSPDSEN
uniref:Uncharacterized protein n=2 Tax=Timema TaxID=61471 RepID=A0A7R9INW1_9NEOP|nr:unnamed protein product [Timema bartmani]CAD7461826.1 unnamed protein product [Timema tahoe]